MNWYKFIHSNLISCFLIGSLVNTQSVLKYLSKVDSSSLKCWDNPLFLLHDRARDRHIDWSIFRWVKLLIFFMFSGILKPFYLQFFINMSKWVCFSVVYELDQYMCKSCCSCKKWFKSSALALMLMFIHMHSPSVLALDEHQNQRATALDLNNFSHICTFIDL